MVAVVQRPFHWAIRQWLIAANPFRDASHRQGEPRRRGNPWDRCNPSLRMPRARAKAGGRRSQVGTGKNKGGS
ncbi:MAG TPA: hypothetical protein VKP69_27855 [Isosphaeraceae bacterium]|nr:hypothetical protein [Isosphaeraceae bacterium]